MIAGLQQRSPAKAWMRALELTAPIRKGSARTLPVVVAEMAVRRVPLLYAA
jgi:hypothetical protein